MAIYSIVLCFSLANKNKNKHAAVPGMLVIFLLASADLY